jgi:hypothetical protein
MILCLPCTALSSQIIASLSLDRDISSNLMRGEIKKPRIEDISRGMESIVSYMSIYTIQSGTEEISFT